MDYSNETILDAFRRLQREEPHRVLFTFVDEDGRDAESLTASQLYQAAMSIADFLATDCNLEPGDRVLLVYPQSLDVVKAFLGCLFAEVIPAPVAPPNPFQPQDDLKTFKVVAAHCGAVAVLTNGLYLNASRLGAAKNLLTLHRDSWPDFPWHRTDNVSPRISALPPYTPKPEDLAYLQYTSGSTSEPKGVMITYANLAHQMHMQRSAFGVNRDTVGFLWVPYFHDMCLIAGIISGMYGNGRLYLMSPLTFLKKPSLWFEGMHRVRATHTAAPDFAYRMIVRQTTPEQRRQWDLSCVTTLGAGGEPNRPATVEQLYDAFAESKLDPAAYCPTFGMAEHALLITQSPAGSRHRELRVQREPLETERRVVLANGQDAGSVTLVGNGTASYDVTVRIVDAESGTALEEGRVGEIWLHSPSKAAGYYHSKEQSERTFGARLQNSDDAREYLRTGDLGFLWEGELFITGRIKDLIIIRGRNIYPQDLEESVYKCSPQLRPGRAVAVAVSEDEHIVVVAEMKDEKVALPALEEIARTIRRQLLQDHQVACHAIALVPPDVLPRTTSGKVRRYACREAFAQGTMHKSALYTDGAVSS